MSDTTADAVEQSAPSSDSNGLALDLAIEAARNDPSLHREVAAFLTDQRQMLADQRHHLHEQLKQLHLGIFEKWLSVLLRLATLCVGIGAATGACLMVWDAAQSKGLLIEPFAVPPDMAEKGLTGQVVASQVLDRLTTMDTATSSFRPPLSYANNWGKDIKVEIPETGVSIGEIRRFLREWLGNDTHISGEVWRTDTGIAISARTGGERGATFTGTQSNFDALVEKAAEHVYGQTQPYRYANYVRNANVAKAHSIYLRLTESASAQERGWAWYGIGNLYAVYYGNTRAAIWAFRKAVAEYPDNTLLHAGLGSAEENIGHNEAAVSERLIVQRLLNRSSIPDVDPAYLATAKHAWSWALPMQLGDYGLASSIARNGIKLPDQSNQRIQMRAAIVVALALQHDGIAARAALQELRRSVMSPARRASLGFQVEAALENWQDLAAEGAAVEKAFKNDSRARSDQMLVEIRPQLALAKAKLGDLSGAKALIASAPDDCYLCLRVRGTIASLAGEGEQADTWFAKAVHDAPSIPFAYTEWGQSLLARGKPDEAIAQFAIANQKGPKFANPLEGWGEALLAKSQSHLALAKFEEAEKYAPNWGRLHMKWGQALVYAGKKDEANKQFARAATLDLTPAEKSELARIRPHV